MEGKDMLATSDGCDLVWPVAAAELYRISLNQVLSYVKKNVFQTKKGLKVRRYNTFL